MIVYRESANTFINQCLTDGSSALSIGSIISKKMRSQGINYFDDSQVRAWDNSLPEIARVLHNGGIHKDVDVAVEYKIQQSRDRIDFLVCGDDDKGNKNVVVIELKQWSMASPSGKQAFVHTFGGHGEGDYWHPSYQAVNYAQILYNFNEYIRENNVSLPACSYLHNMDRNNEVLLGDVIRFPLVQESPVFYCGDEDELGSFIKKFISQPNHRLLYEIEDSRIIPSKYLANMLAEAINGNGFFSYDEAQATSVAEIVEAVQEANYYNQKKTIIIKGGAGTGKSVVAINVLGQLVNGGKKRMNAVYSTANASPRYLYTEQLVKNDFKKRQIEALFVYPTVFLRAPENSYDCALVDEAHRVFDFKGGVGMTKHQHILESIIKSSKVSVFFIDPDQAVTTTDYATIENIKETARRLHSEVVERPELELKTQFRVTGGEEYISFIKSFLGYNNDITSYYPKNYDFKVFDSATELRDALREKERSYATESESGKCRLVAGYTYEWVSKGDNRDGEKYDIILDDGKFQAKWNLRCKEVGAHYSWVNDPESFEEVGCIHTCQGIDLNYCGVIIGKDLVFRDGKVRFNKLATAKSDRNSGIRKANDALAEKLIRNTYNVLLTRGMLGTYVYCEDDALREHLASMVLDHDPIQDEEAEEAIIDFSEYILLPIVGSIAAGTGIVMDEDIEGNIYTPLSLVNSREAGKYFWLRVNGESMVNAEIFDGDYALIRRMSNPKADVHRGDIVAFQIQGEDATLKRYFPADDAIVLHPENDAFEDIRVSYQDIYLGEAQIIGKMITCLHKDSLQITGDYYVFSD